MTTALQAENIWKLYASGESSIEAVRQVNLSLQEGAFVSIMGPSGCGKTTLLNVLSGIDEPSSGQVFVNGEALYGITDNARTDLRAKYFGFIFQEFNLLPVLSAVENVELPLLMQGIPPSIARKQAIAMLERVGLGDRVSHRPTELSGGQQQRVAIARALVHEPAIVLCDEPTGNLDGATSAEILQLLREMNQALKTTFLIVTHDVGVSKQCDRVITMNDGIISMDVIQQAHEEE